MTNDETDIGGPPRSFPSTLWTIVLKAKEIGNSDRSSALGRLIETYWKPAYLFIRRKGYDSEAGKDLAQSFFTALLEKNYLQYVERGRGRFRTFLFVALEHFLSNERGRARTMKRGSGRTPLSLDYPGAESEVTLQPAIDIPPDLAFRRDWAVRVMNEAMQLVAGRWAAAGRKAEFDLLKSSLAQPRGGVASYTQVAQGLGISEAEVRKKVHRLRLGYREALLEVIRAYSESEEESREELNDLFSAFS